jgi:hypothetical protein
MKLFPPHLSLNLEKRQKRKIKTLKKIRKKERLSIKKAPPKDNPPHLEISVRKNMIKKEYAHHKSKKIAKRPTKKIKILVIL